VLQPAPHRIILPEAQRRTEHCAGPIWRGKIDERDLAVARSSRDDRIGRAEIDTDRWHG
jgi:hypothetical protein